MKISKVHLHSLRLCSGFTLAEVMMSVGIVGVTGGGIVSGYVMSSQRAEWSACSAAAQSLAMQRVEQTRAAKWDSLAYPTVDEVASDNFPVTIQALDIPMASTNAVYATNKTTIQTVSDDPPLKMVRVDCSWSFMSRGPFTNTITVYRAPDQ